MNDIAVYWRHVGREHEPDGYAAELLRNPEDVIEQYRQHRLAGIVQRQATDRFAQVNAETIVEYSTDPNSKPFIIIYRPMDGLQLSLGFKRSAPWWLIDIVDVSEVRPGIFEVADLFVDIRIIAPDRYQVLDMDDLRLAVETGIVGVDETVKILASIGTAIAMLNDTTFPPNWLVELVREYVPALTDRAAAPS